MGTHTPLTAVFVCALCLAACIGQDAPRKTAANKQKVAENTLSQAPEKIQYPLKARLEDKATYLGLDIKPRRLRPGGRVQLTHYWQVHKPLSGWKVFVHLNDPTLRRFVNADHVPVDGNHPVSDWQAGTIVRDSHSIHLPQDWSGDKLRIYTGMWRGSERMKVQGPSDGQNRILAAEIPVMRTGARNRAKKALRAERAQTAPLIDGKAGDAVWERAAPSPAFVETMTGRPSPSLTRVRAAWDDEYLYFLFEMKDEDIWGDFDKRDDKLWTQEAVEVFIDANGDMRDYIELQVSPKGTIFDSYLPSYRKNQNDWNSELKATVGIDGSLNERDDKDEGWRVEMALPWKDTIGRGTHRRVKIPPQAGQRFRVNFFRMDKPKEKAQQASAWSPPLRGDFHALDRFGELVLTGPKQGNNPAIEENHGKQKPR